MLELAILTVINAAVFFAGVLWGARRRRTVYVGQIIVRPVNEADGGSDG